MENARMKGVVIVLGVLLLLAGGAVAGAKFAPADALSFLSSMPAAKDFVASPTALYAGGGGAGLGLLLIIIGAVTGGKKQKPVPARPAPPPPPHTAPPPPRPGRAPAQGAGGPATQAGREPGSSQVEAAGVQPTAERISGRRCADLDAGPAPHQPQARVRPRFDQRR